MTNEVEEVVAEELPLLQRFDDIPYKEDWVELDRLPPDGELTCPAPSKAFLADVKYRGIINPIKITKKTRGQGYIVKDGRNRIKAARTLGRTAIKARVYEKDCLELDLAITAENNQRRPNDLSDLLIVSKYREEGYGDSAIAKMTGIAPGRVKKISKLVGMNADLWNGVVAGKVSLGAARLAAKLSAPAQRTLVKTLNDNDRLTLEDVAVARTTARHETYKASISLPDMALPACAKPLEKPYIVLTPGSPRRFATEPEARTIARKHDLSVYQLVQV